MAGTDTSAPMIPQTDEKTVTPRITASGWMSTALDMSSGCRTLDSICCTASTTPIMIRAATHPLLAKAMSTATIPESTAPTTGMKAIRKVNTAIGTTSGTPSSRAPRPIPTASTAATMICVRE